MSDLHFLILCIFFSFWIIHDNDSGNLYRWSVQWATRSIWNSFLGDSLHWKTINTMNCLITKKLLNCILYINKFLVSDMMKNTFLPSLQLFHVHPQCQLQVLYFFHLLLLCPLQSVPFSTELLLLQLHNNHQASCWWCGNGHWKNSTNDIIFLIEVKFWFILMN